MSNISNVKVCLPISKSFKIGLVTLNGLVISCVYEITALTILTPIYIYVTGNKCDQGFHEIPDNSGISCNL